MTEIPYDQIPAIMAQLFEDGLHPSADRVRKRMGDRGSNETIQRAITARLRELGRLPEDEISLHALPAAPYTIPDPDPMAVARHLAHLRDETARRTTDALVGALTGVLHELAPALKETRGISRNDLAMPHPDGSIDMLSRGIPELMAWAARLHGSLRRASTGGFDHGHYPPA